MADKRRNALASPEMRETPVRNRLAQYAGNALTAVDEFARAPFGYQNPPAAMLSDALGVPAVASTLNRLAYGEPLTTGAGMTTRLRPDTVDAAMAVAPVAAKFPRAVGGAALGLMGGAGNIAGANSLAAAAAMGKTNKTRTLYHGSPREFDVPDTPYGGAYFAEDPVVAERYAVGPDGIGQVGKYDVDASKVFDAEKATSSKVLDRIEKEYDNKTDYRDPDDGEYMPLRDWVKSGYLFKLGRKVQNEVMAALEAEGYHAVRYRDASPMTGDSISWVVFDKNRLKRSE